MVDKDFSHVNSVSLVILLSARETYLKNEFKISFGGSVGIMILMK